MDANCYNYLKSKPSLLRFVRLNPVWYRYLSRDPSRVMEIEKEAKKFYGKTLPQKFERASSQISMMKMLYHLATMSD
ncbi:YlbE-like family protein [Virgibacillus flavescens]|uniref:YlbE-like family protein n=1 Tax=Virgibacillus flavescens TaxID=1611422 RepID=UPI003D347ED6